MLEETLRRGAHCMPAYRVYCLDGAGKVWAAEWIEAEDDAAAIEAARKFDKAVRCEVWQGQKLIGRVEPDRPMPIDDDDA